MSDSRPDAGHEGVIDDIAVEQSPFRELERRQRGFVFPLPVPFLVWYFASVPLSSFATEFMSQRVVARHHRGSAVRPRTIRDHLVITMAYVSYANRRLDLQAEEIRTELEAAEGVAKGCFVSLRSLSDRLLRSLTGHGAEKATSH